MKRNNKKGFTIVELVIVIAVIAILSAVLIPTFGSVISDAQETARLQEAKNLFTTYVAENAKDGDVSGNGYIVVDGYYFEVTNGNIVEIDDEADRPTTATNADYKILACNKASTHNTEKECESCKTKLTAPATEGDGANNS